MSKTQTYTNDDLEEMMPKTLGKKKCFNSPAERKVSVEVSESKNFNKVTITVHEEKIKCDNEEDLRAQIRQIAKALREECELQLNIIGQGKTG